VLEFSKTVNVTTLQLQFLILQTLHDRPLQAYTLTSGTVTTENDYILSFLVDQLDLFNVKDLDYVCTCQGNMLQPASEDTIMDISGNMLVPIESAIPGKMVSQFVPDTVTPELL